MSGLERQYQTDTKFRVVNNAGSRFVISMQSMCTGRYYYTPGQFDTYYGTSYLKLDIRTYPGWKGELRSCVSADQVQYFLMPWSGYDLTKYYPEDLPIQSCILTYTADYMESETQYTANVESTEILSSWDDLVGLQGRIGDVARPRYPLFGMIAGGSSYYQIRQENTETELPQFKPRDKYVIPLGIREGETGWDYSGGTYKVTSTVNIELVE